MRNCLGHRRPQGSLRYLSCYVPGKRQIHLVLKSAFAHELVDRRDGVPRASRVSDAPAFQVICVRIGLSAIDFLAVFREAFVGRRAVRRRRLVSEEGREADRISRIEWANLVAVTSCPPRASHRSEALNSSAKYSGDTKSSWPDSLPQRGTKVFALCGGLSSCSDSSRCSTEWLLQGACWLTNGALSMGVCHTTSREESR